MLRNPTLLGIVLATALGWASWTLVLLKMSPFVSGNLALAFFYSSLILALTGAFSLLLYALRWGFASEETAPHFGVTLREGFLLALMIAIALAFERLRVLTWWDALLLLAIVLLLEFYFLARD